MIPMEWSVRIRAAGQPGTLTDDQVFEVLEELEGLAPVASLARDGSSIAVRLALAGDTADTLDAVSKGAELVKAALQEAGLTVGPGRDLDITEAEASSMEMLERELETPSVPEVIGVTELADMLKVSKQRASSLAKAKSFPRPLAVLASGPVWAKTTVLRFVKEWPRRPGRPPKSIGQVIALSPGAVPMRPRLAASKAAAKKAAARGVSKK